MASYPAPSANLQIFNPKVFDTEDVALSLADANRLYAKKSGAIFYGAVAMPSLSLNGVGVGSKLNEIDANSAKLTDITYNNNTTTILNDISVIGDIKIGSVTITEEIVIAFGIRLSDVESTLTRITYEIFGDLTKINSNLIITGNLQLGTITNVENSILENKQKTTKISYDEGSSMTTIGDTLKSSGTLIVGSQNYNASDQFEKLQNISKSGNTLTIDDSINITGNLRLPLFEDVNSQLNLYDEILTDITFDDVSLTTKIARDFEVAGNFKLNTIPDVEQKIIDLSNATIPYITYDSVGDELVVTKDTNITGNLQLGSITDVENAINNAGTPYITYESGKLVVTKNMDLGTNDLTCNFMRRVGSSYGLSENWDESYLEFKNGGSNLDARYPDGTGRELYLNFFAEKDIFLGSPFGTQNTYVLGHLRVQETIGSPPDSGGGSLTLQHNDIGGTSSIVFTSKTNGDDYGYISYKDDVGDNPDNNQSVLEIGVQNDGDGSNVDNIALMPSGYVGINTRNPETDLDVNGNTNISGNLQLGSIANVEDAINNAGGVPSITYNSVTETTTFGGSFVVIPSDIPFQLGLITNLYTYIIALNSRTSWLQNVSQGLKINNNTIIEENLGLRTSQLSIRPVDDLEDAVQEIYSKNGVATLKLGDNDGTTTTFSNILKSENGNASFYGSGEKKYMEYNSNDDIINISKDMDLGTNDLNCKFMRPYFGGAKYFLSQNFNSSYLEFRNGGHHLDAFSSNGDGRSLILNQYSESDIILGSQLNNSTTKINGKLEIVETIGTSPSAVGGGSLTLFHDDPGGTSSIVFKSKTEANNDFGYISYIDDYEGSTTEQRSLLELGAKDDSFSTRRDNIALMPSGFVGVNTRNPQTTLDVSGEIDCNEIKVNQMPLNSFTNYKIGSNFNFGTWGRGNQIIYQNIPAVSPITSHGTLQFSKTADNLSFSCLEFGTYEITTNVVFRNTGSSRQNPCIGISINDDTNYRPGSTIGPNWDLTPYNQTPFAVAYVRYDQGKVCSLTAKRTHHFTNEIDLVEVKTYLQSATGDTFHSNISGITNFLILSATIQFKYIGNFNSIA
tara:strand:- start:371 stop:3601 length:3231 start_codon:yes stop_codon:yes gene_type:complete